MARAKPSCWPQAVLKSKNMEEKMPKKRGPKKGSHYRTERKRQIACFKEAIDLGLNDKTFAKELANLLLKLPT